MFLVFICYLLKYLHPTFSHSSSHLINNKKHDNLKLTDQTLQILPSPKRYLKLYSIINFLKLLENQIVLASPW